MNLWILSRLFITELSQRCIISKYRITTNFETAVLLPIKHRNAVEIGADSLYLNPFTLVDAEISERIDTQDMTINQSKRIQI